MSIFERLKSGLSRSREELAKGLAGVFKSSRLDAGAMHELEEALLGADLGPELSAKLLKALSAQDLSQGRLALANTLEKLAGQPGQILSQAPLAKPEVTLVVGVNGSGKTTTCGKLGALWQSKGQKVLLAGADTFRAAAVEQLRLWAERSGAGFFSQGQDSDPSATAFDAVSKAEAGGYDRVIIDTAGRLQTKTNLMEELRKVARVTGKALAGAPHRSILVLDGTAGRNMISQARLFNEVIPLSGLVITKLDGTAKAGAVLAVIDELKIPVECVGVGEGADDLQPYDPAAFVQAMVAE
jgi:fused signal recognition particle receptor